MTRIYLDHAATTPLDPQVLEKMVVAMGQSDGNPSSLHTEGRRTKQLIDLAREHVSEALGCLFGEIVFTSSGTEAANQALLGVAWAAQAGPRRRILIGASEHHCVLHCRETLESLGFTVELIPCGRDGGVSPSAVQALLGEDVLLVSVMHANNETGVINDIPAISALAHNSGALMHTDCVQTFPGPWTVDSLGADLVNISAHKIHGPKGVGALYVRGGTPVKPLVWGGGQEREMRAGTENVAGIVGLGWATVFARATDYSAGKRAARDAFLAGLAGVLVPTVSDPATPVLPGHAHLRSPGIDAETILIRLDREGISASSGAACSSGSLEPSHVLLAAGFSAAEAGEGLRFTFGRGSTVAEAEAAAKIVAEVVSEIRGRRGLG